MIKNDTHVDTLAPYKVGLLLSRATRNSNQLRESILEKYSLSSPEWYALGLIQSYSASGGVKVSDIAAELDVNPTYATALIRRLQDKRLVQSRVLQADRRSRLVTVTKRGALKENAVSREIEETLAIIRQRVGGATFDSYLVTLSDLAYNKH